jgi:hypothetical protein
MGFLETLLRIIYYLIVQVDGLRTHKQSCLTIKLLLGGLFAEPVPNRT